MARGACYLLIYLTAVYPLHPAIAAGITPDNNRTQVQNQGNVPIVNIATPNGAGISHNTYKEFNVATQGAVLNNATQAVKSQLAGQLNANPNLNGKSAELIINEVTGNGRSNLQGKLEIVGHKANVMIANPNGITCDGCGFINTGSATLTTGKPQFDKQGALEALEVKKGQITIGGKGLDGKSTDYIDIISRATELNGKIQAQNLSLTQGANRIDFNDGTVKKITGEGAKPQLAVDTKALGGMYANKIRLVATEDGVGVNLKDLISDQRDITLNVNGKIELGNITAKTDFNLSARETHIAPNIKIQAERDITLASTKLDNKGSVTAGRDARIFGDTLRNIGDKALLQANNNMWLQKDAQGNKSTLIENKSATIKTVKGDLVVRTDKLENIVERCNVVSSSIDPNSKKMDKVFGSYYGGQGPSCGGGGICINVIEVKFKGGELDKWFGVVDLYNSNYVNETKQVYSVNMSPSSIIRSGGNAYINSLVINNKLSNIESDGDLFLTGGSLNNESLSFGTMNGYGVYDLGIPEPILSKVRENRYFDHKGTGIPVFPRNQVFEAKKSNNLYTWIEGTHKRAEIKAGGNLVADFRDLINIQNSLPVGSKKTSEVTVISRPDTLSAKNILLHAGKINITDKLKAIDGLNIISENDINLNNASLISSNSLSMTAANNIHVLQGELKSKDVTIISRNGDIQFQSGKPEYFNPDNTRKISSLEATGDLLLHAGKNILLRNILLTKSHNVSLAANNDITIDNNSDLLTHKRMGDVTADSKEQTLFNQMLSKLGKLDAKSSVVINAGGNLSVKGVNISAVKDINLTSAKNIDLTPRELSPSLSRLFPSSRSGELSSRLTAGNNINIISGADINGKAAQINAKGNTLLSAGRNINLLALGYSAIDNKNDNNKDDRHIVAVVNGGKQLTLAANGTLITQGSTLSSGGNTTISSGGNMRFESVQNHSYREKGREFTESVTQQGTALTSGGILTVISNGSILFQATKLTAKGAMDVAAKGGYLYAQAMEESSHYEKTETKRKWYGKKKTIKRTRHDVTNKVTEFTAGGDINLLSRDDSTYEASKIATNKNAKLTSTHGKVNFKAVKNTSFEQTITYSKGFYIKQRDKGYTETQWVLPQIFTGGKLTVEAANGVSADIKAKNGQSLQNVLAVLGNTPETAWLKGLRENKDIQWNVVKDAYDSWDHKSQHLNPVVSAVIAIAAAAATAGSSLAASVASYAGNSVAGGALTAGMSSLAAQAAVAIVDNQGDISKALKVLGSSDAVKSTITSMAIGGALAGFDSYMGWDKAADGTKLDPTKAKLPQISNGDWNKVVQRVAGQSIISSSLNTAINGGSFKDNLTTALLANIGSQINAEGARLIGDNGEVLGVPGKTLSHAVVAGISAEIGRGNVKGAMAGALAAELAGVMMGDNLIKAEEWQRTSERQAQIARVFGGFAGAVFTGKADGAYSGASSAENTFRYNYLAHHQRELMEKELASESSYLKKVQIFAKWGLISNTQDGYLAAGFVSGIPSELYDSAMAIVGAVSNPSEIIESLRTLLIQEDMPGFIWQATKDGYLKQLDIVKAEYEKAGSEGAYNAGLEIGKLVTGIASMAAGGLGAVKGSTSATAKLSKVISKDPHPTVDIRHVYRIEKDGSKTPMEWGGDIYKQGYPFEDFVATQMPKGSRLPKNTEAFDFYDEKTRVATSVKTLDTRTASKIKNPKQLYSSIKKNINDAANFTGGSKGPKVIDSSMISQREVWIAVPKTTTPDQWEQINRAITYGAEKNVNVKITVVK
ncbi:hemagglutinin [Photorhabdus luminescens subsp. luminescens]|nr:hemagglutinin [Photorhabdus luminescens subsp. luminescens]